DAVPGDDADWWSAKVWTAKSHLARPAQHFDPAELGAERFGLVGGAVGAAVVDDEDVRTGYGRAHAVYELHDVLDLVEGGNRDPNAAHVALFGFGTWLLSLRDARPA